MTEIKPKFVDGEPVAVFMRRWGLEQQRDDLLKLLDKAEQQREIERLRDIVKSEGANPDVYVPGGLTKPEMTAEIERLREWPFADGNNDIFVEVFYQQGDPPFICKIHGAMGTSELDNIEKLFDENHDYFGDGDGHYRYRVEYVSGESNEFGTSADYPDPQQIGFMPLKRTEGGG